MSVQQRDGTVLVARICKCGHWASEHERGLDCAHGWSGELEEEPCDCQGFDFDFEEWR